MGPTGHGARRADSDTVTDSLALNPRHRLSQRRLRLARQRAGSNN